MNTHKFSKDWLLKIAENKPSKRMEYRDTENRYLRLIIHPTGNTKLCVYKCPMGKRAAVRVALPFSINNAMPSMQRIRAEANQIIAKLDKGINPNDESSYRHKNLTLQSALDNYLSNSTNTPRVIINWRNSIETHLNKWLNKQLAELCTPERIYAMHRSIMIRIAEDNNARNKPGNGGIGANEVMKKFRRVLNFNRALNKAYKLPHWPTEELGPSGLKMWMEQKPRTRRIHREELPLFWQALHTLECPLQQDLFKFLLLTGCRSGEARGVTASDINWHRQSITFRKTKNGNDHSLPLTPTLLNIVNTRVTCTDSEYLFPLNDPKAITKHISKSCGLHISPHDLRRTFAGVAEAAGIGSTTKKDLLNHLSGRDLTDDYTGKTEFDDLRVALQKIEDKILVFSNQQPQNTNSFRS